MNWHPSSAARVSANHPVVVVGAGPVGMTCAAALAAAQVPVVIVESKPEPASDWRASTFHAPTLELLDTIGITDHMLSEGLRVPRYQFRDRRAGLIAEFDFTMLADETPFPFRLQLNQQHLVRMLYERVQSDPLVSLRFATSVTGVDVNRWGALVSVEDGTGQVEQLAASYVIGADGARSTVRSAMSIPFEGFTYPERFAITSTLVDLQGLLPGLGYVNYIADPQEWLFVLRTPESWRVVWPVPESVSAEEATRSDTLQRQMQAVAPYGPGYPIIDNQLYNVHQRVASTFRVGPVLLAGDAAHVNSPVGGVGLNSGIHDSMDAVRRLARIAHESADPDAELTAFERTRRSVAVEYVRADTQRNTDRLRETDDIVRRGHHQEMRAIAADANRARAYMRRACLLESVQKYGIGVPPSDVPASE